MDERFAAAGTCVAKDTLRTGIQIIACTGERYSSSWAEKVGSRWRIGSQTFGGLHRRL